MEPRIQYAKTEDAVSIAFWTLGEGPPLVVISVPTFSHLEMDWQIPEIRNLYERLAEKRMLVRYDSRGTGLSQRDISDHSLDALTRDLEAVVDRLGLERFALMSWHHMGTLALTYSASHPDTVSHLILWCSWAKASEYYRSPAVQSLGSLRGQDWQMYTETMAQAFTGWSGALARRMAEVFRESITQEQLLAFVREAGQWDAAPILPSITAPTLVLHRRQFRLVPVDLARALASHITSARLVLLEGESGVPFTGDTEAVTSAIDEFLGEGEEAELKTDLPQGTAIILFSDIVDSTSLTEQLGDATFREKARELDTSLRGIIRETGGTLVEGKVLGDGVLAVFTSARQAIECALRCNAASDSVDLRLHLGIHAGDVIREGNNVYGGAVNIAARIAAASAPGEVLVSDTVRSLARTSAGVAFDDRGEQSLKGVAEPQRLYVVRGGGE